jgi:hypothetical protein
MLSCTRARLVSGPGGLCGSEALLHLQFCRREACLVSRSVVGLVWTLDWEMLLCFYWVRPSQNFPSPYLLSAMLSI